MCEITFHSTCMPTFDYIPNHGVRLPHFSCRCYHLPTRNDPGDKDLPIKPVGTSMYRNLLMCSCFCR